MKRLLELTDIEIRMGFAASCVETAAKQAGCTYKEMYRRMKRVGLINNYILRHYETIHTESRGNITADILETLGNWEASQGITAPKGTHLYVQNQHLPNNQMCLLSQPMVRECLHYVATELIPHTDQQKGK